MDTITLGSMTIDFKAMARDQRLIAEKRMKCADATEFSQILGLAADLVAAHSNVPREQAFTMMVALVTLEVGYPTRSDVYYSEFYETSRTYRGVTQASAGNWTDSRDIARFLERSVTSAPLLHQLLAVWAYLKRGCAVPAQRVLDAKGAWTEFAYRDLPLLPVVVYTVHQQGYNAAVPLLFAERTPAGKQSDASINFINTGLRQLRAQVKL